MIKKSRDTKGFFYEKVRLAHLRRLLCRCLWECFKQGHAFLAEEGHLFVGVPGFEPRTSCSQSTRATKLRHTPFDATDYIVDNPTAVNHL